MLASRLAVPAICAIPAFKFLYLKPPIYSLTKASGIFPINFTRANSSLNEKIPSKPTSQDYQPNAPKRATNESNLAHTNEELPKLKDNNSSESPFQLPSNNSSRAGTTSLVDRAKQFIKENGRYGLVTYVGVSASIFLSIFLSIKTYLDVDTVLQYLGLQENELAKNGGPIALTFFLYKFAMPLRLSLALILTPRLKPYLSKFF